MAGLGPAIHAFFVSGQQVVDARHKAGHDDQYEKAILFRIDLEDFRSVLCHTANVRVRLIAHWNDLRCQLDLQAATLWCVDVINVFQISLLPPRNKNLGACQLDQCDFGHTNFTGRWPGLGD